MYKILLACGSGISSGFMASAMRKYAKKQGIAAEVKAVADPEIMNYVEDYDVLMLGPHLQYKFEAEKRKLAGKNIPVCLIEQKKYAMLDGEGIFKDAVEAVDACRSSTDK